MRLVTLGIPCRCNPHIGKTLRYVQHPGRRIKDAQRSRSAHKVLTSLASLRKAHEDQRTGWRWYFMRWGHLKLLRPCDA